MGTPGALSALTESQESRQNGLWPPDMLLSMKHHPPSQGGDRGSTGHTLSEGRGATGRTTAPYASHAQGPSRVSRICPDRKGTVSALSRCQAPYCWGSADYRIPERVTPRTTRGALELCVECFEAYVERLETSILLPGEPCEWRLTLHHAENIFDGGHDWRRNLLRSQCKHRACADARTAKQSDLSPPTEVSA